MNPAKEHKSDFTLVDEFTLNPQYYIHKAIDNALMIDLEGMKTNRPPNDVFQLFIHSVNKLESVLVACKKLDKDELKNKDSEYNKELNGLYTDYVEELKKNNDKALEQPLVLYARLANFRYRLLMQKAFEGRTVEKELYM